MNSNRFLAALALCAAILPAQAQVLSDCREVTSPVPEPGAWTVGARQFATLWDVYHRIAKVADLAPDLWLCESVAAQAAARADGTAIMVTTGLLRLTGGDADELASVIGHEFGHIIHAHGERRARVAMQARVRLERSLSNAKNVKEAHGIAWNAAGNVTAFSRETEREADDEGFSLARQAGFSHAGMRRMFEKMAQKYGVEQGGYLASHPGLGDRVKGSGRLEMNETYRERASRHFVAREAAELRKVVDEWRKQIPDSGAAAYYDAMHGLMTGSRAATARLDEAVGYFHGEGLSSIAQAYQAESSHAPLALCVSLFRQGEKGRALECLQLLKTDEELRQFRAITGWNAFVFVPTASADGTALYASRVVDGTVAMTNCKRVASEANLPVVRAWRVPPSAGRKAVEPVQMVCSPDMCNCREASDEEKAAVSRASRPAR